jgi:hypothetical protein
MMPELKPKRRAMLNEAIKNVNRPRPAVSEDGVMGVGPGVPPTQAVLPVDIQADSDFRSFVHSFTDAETDNSTSAVNEPSVAQSGGVIFYTANWFTARSNNGGNSFTYVDPNVALPPISGQYFCCDQSVIFDRSRKMGIWISLWINSSQTTGTIRIAVTEDALTWRVYDITSASFGLAGLPDYPHIALGANYLYLTINHFYPIFTESTWAALSLTEMKQGISTPITYINRTEFNLKAAHDFGPSTKTFFATHVDNDTIRVFRWNEGSSTVSLNDIDIPAWTRGTRGSFDCTTPDGNNPCDRMDDRILGGFVMGPTKLPVGSNAQKVVGFSWTARQDANFQYPYTNVVRIDAESMTLIDNPVIWSSGTAFFYADFHPNDRGDLGGVLDQAGGAYHPAFAATLLDQDTVVLPPWQLFGLLFGDDSPDDDKWGDYNTVRRWWPNGYQFIAGGHVMRGGGSNSDVESCYARFGRERDIF